MIHIKRITTDVALSEVYKFRQRVLVEELGYIADEKDNLSDIYDNYAHNYAAYAENGEIAGVMRVVVDSPIGLPVEKLKPLNGARKDKYIVEACRLAVAKDYRSSRLFIKLIAAAYQCAMKIGSTHMVLDTYLNEEPLYKRLGFKRVSEPYTDPESNRGSLVVAMMAEISNKSIPLIENRAIQLALMSTANEIEHGQLENERTIHEELSVY